MSASLSPTPKIQFNDINGNPLVGGKIYTYAAGTTTPQTTYTDATQVTPNTNPIILDARGEANIWLTDNLLYFVVLHDSLDNLIWSVDNVGSTVLAKLAASNGSTFVGWIRPSTGAVATTVSNWITRYTPSVFDFMTTAQIADVQARTTLVDVTVPIQAAITASSQVYFPAGTYLVSGAITVASGKKLIGDGFGSTTIKTNSATADIFNVTGNQVLIEGFGFTSSVTRTSGSYVNFTASSSQVTLRDFYMDTQYIGVRMTASAEGRIQFGTMFGGATSAGSAGILVDGGNDQYINQVTMDAPAGSQPAAGIQVVQTGALNITDCDIIHHTNDLYINPGNGQSVAAVYALNCYFDTAVRGILIDPTGTGTIIRCRFVACWTSSHTNEGVLINANGTGPRNGIEFIGHHCFLNGANGFLAQSGTTPVIALKIIGGIFAQNTLNGIAIGAAVSSFSIIGIDSGAYAGLSGNGNWGILIASGASDNYIIQSNKLFGNTSGSISDSGTGLNKRVSNNLPYIAPAQTTPTVTASPWTYTNNSTSFQTAYINGGTVSLVSVGGSSVFQQTNCTIRIPPGVSMVVTYTVAPGVGVTTD